MSSPDSVFHPQEYEAEKASNSYIMSLVAVAVGLPLPIINLIATIVFAMANRKSTYFVRWHCTQALLSQLTLVILNSIGFWWTISIITESRDISNAYFGYLIPVVLFNIAELIANIYAAIETRKGKHVSFFFFGELTNLIVRK
ncbi:MAG: DUF4870 domain-containing protein [Sphingobacteriales bacterium]|jgi:uncharacterized membrane protein